MRSTLLLLGLLGCRTPYSVDADADGWAASEDCDDTDASINPGAEEAECPQSADGIDNDCNRRTDQGCALDSIEADVTIQGDHTYAYFASAVSGNGDLNGDGYNDLLISSFGYDTPDTDYFGRAYVFFGPLSTSTDGSRADIFINGTQDDGYLSIGLESEGDYDGDGYDDLLIASIDSTHIFYGPLSSGSTNQDQADVNFIGTDIYYLGASLLKAVDIDDDGLDEVVLGVETTTTSAVAIFAQPNGTVRYEDATVALIESDPEYPHGKNAALADFDGDGVVDVAYTKMVHSRGYIINGPFSGTLDSSDADTTLFVSSGVESAVSGLSSDDFNSDGYADLVVGSMLSSYGTNDGGLVAIFSGPITSDLDVEADFSFATYSTSPGSYLGSGYNHLHAGDIDSDGHEDLVISVGYDNDAGSSAGTIFLNYGPLSGSQSTLTYDRAIFGSESSYFGYGSDIGDLNGDGEPDLIGGAFGPLSQRLWGGPHLLQRSTVSLPTPPPTSRTIRQQSPRSTGGTIAISGTPTS